MIFRTTIHGAILVAGVLLCQGVATAQDCGDGECPTAAKAKPLNIMQFMREQAASTRVTAPPHTHPRVTAKVKRPAHRAIAARRKPVMPAEAAASFASRPETQPTLAGPSAPAADDSQATRAAEMDSSETVGAAVSNGPNVRLVDAEEFNDIDRKAEQLPAQVAASQTRREQASVSWLRWIWSAVGSAFAALATAVHQLLRL